MSEQQESPVNHDSQAPTTTEPTPEQRQYAMFCHLAAFSGLVIPFGSIIVPLILWLMKKDESEFINHHGREALNFNITMAFISLFCLLLFFVVIGMILMPFVLMAWLIMIIIAAIKANDGESYRYPFSLRLIS
ncbi:MAG: DUF4870 domain-containing protein [Gammaproteobacteria bacterium]|nr:DUF4870 domain-containing protein [Gammaproteobacteria bacterium]NVK88139.1 DUF4870 domain-containing protein [Gammaproteobacteria bacterium]